MPVSNTQVDYHDVSSALSAHSISCHALPFPPSPSTLPCPSLLLSPHNPSLFIRLLRLNNGYESLFLFQNLKAIGEPIKLTHIARTVESMSYTNSKLLEQRPILTFMTVKNAKTGEKEKRRHVQFVHVIYFSLFLRWLPLIFIIFNQFRCALHLHPLCQLE
jgi:hypothetical protein